MTKTNFKNFVLRKDATDPFEPIKKSKTPDWFSDWVEKHYEINQEKMDKRFEKIEDILVHNNLS